MNKAIKVVIVVAAVVLIAVLSIVLATAAMHSNVSILSFFRANQSARDDTDIVAVVGDIPISRAEIQMRQRRAELSKQIAFEQIENMDVPEEKKQVEYNKAAAIATDYQTCLEEAVREQALVMEAQKLGLSFGHQEALKSVTSDYEALKTAVQQNQANASLSQNYQILVDYMTVEGISESEYLDRAADAYQRMMSRDALIRRFCERYSAEHDGAQASQKDIDAYVESVIESYHVRYYD